MTWLLITSGLLMALLSGMFLDFSDFVMRGLVQAPKAEGSSGMVGLNRTVYRSIFMVLFMGFLPVTAGLVFMAFSQLSGPAFGMIIVGAVLYYAGVVGMTMLGNVPLNHKLDAMADDYTKRADFWPEFAKRWTPMNHVRTASSASAAAMWLFAANML